jgi:hypothetical protein
MGADFEGIFSHTQASDVFSRSQTGAFSPWGI